MTQRYQVGEDAPQTICQEHICSNRSDTIGSDTLVKQSVVLICFGLGHHHPISIFDNETS